MKLDVERFKVYTMSVIAGICILLCGLKFDLRGMIGVYVIYALTLCWVCLEDSEEIRDLGP